MSFKIDTKFLFISLSLPLFLAANDHNVTLNHSESNTTFTSTYWRLMNLSVEDSMLPEEMRREPHMVFSPMVDGKGKFNGATGCNGMLGQYVIDENNITIDTKHIAMTRMACPQMKIESEFIEMLGQAKLWKIDKNKLEFLDSNGTVISFFEAVNKPEK